MINKQYTAPYPLNVEHALEDIKRQIGILVQQSDSTWEALYPIEFITEEALEHLRKTTKTPRLIISGSRAQYLGWTFEQPQTYSMNAEQLTLKELLSIADPTLAAPTTPVHSIPTQEQDEIYIKFAKQAGLLPAVIAAPLNTLSQDLSFSSYWQQLPLHDMVNYIQKPTIELLEIARSALPLDHSANNTLIAFRVRHAANTHLALIIGDKPLEDNALTRVHSSCLTGDLLGSLRCDCGDQLALAIEHLCKAGSGVLIYLNQEGRGIGIANKLRAYHLQDQGKDTYDANLALGFEKDERDYHIASAILKHLAVARIKLLTNNPAKIEALEKSGIQVTERIALKAKPNTHNEKYLSAKSDKSGHLF